MPPLLNASLPCFAVVEGIFFSGSFYTIFWFNQRGILPGLCFTNELISRDEALHCDFACTLYRCLLKPPCSICIHVDSAIQIEDHFICEVIPDGLPGMNAPLMAQYIPFCADYILHELKQPSLYNVNNPFPWMDVQSLPPRKSQLFQETSGRICKEQSR